MIKKMLRLPLLVVALVILSACGHDDQDILAESIAPENMEIAFTMADYIQFTSIDDLLSMTTHVVMVEVLDARAELMNTWLPCEILGDADNPQELYEVFTVTTLRILEVFQGTHEPGNIIEVWQLGGTLGNKQLVNLDMTPLPVGDELILFLEDNSLDTAWSTALVNHSQSAYRLSPSIIRNELSTNHHSILQAYDMGKLNASERLESLNDSNALTLTISDLIRLADSAGSNPKS